MSKVEFLLLIPGVLYGVGLVDLLKVTYRKHYFEIYFWAFFLLLILVLQWYSLYNNIGMAEDQPALFLLMLAVPLVFAQACYTLTPNEEGDTKEYWELNARRFFIIILLMAALNATLQAVYEIPDERQTGRIIGMALIAIAAIWQNKIYRIVLVLMLNGVFFSYLL